MRYKGISQSAKLMWGRLAQYAGKDGRCYPEFGELSEEIGLSESAARKVLRELREAKLIYIRYPEGKERLMHMRCEYFFLDHEIFHTEFEVRAGVSEIGHSGIPENGECKEYPKMDSAKEENHRRESGIRESSKTSLSGNLPDAGLKKKFHGSGDDLQLARKMYDAIIVVNQTLKEPNFERWANSIRLMREQDGRTHDDIYRVFTFANRDQFWGSNILSPDALRRHYAKLAPKAGLVRSVVRGVGSDVMEIEPGRTCGECELCGKGRAICNGDDADPRHAACELFRARCDA
jgi:DNA-binding transcriptional ArsR family regulator